MGFIKCVECENMISERAVFCPRCGCISKIEFLNNRDTSEEVILPWRKKFLFDLFGKEVDVLSDFDWAWEYMMDMLTERAARYLRMYYQKGMSYSEISRGDGYASGGTVSNKINETLNTIRNEDTKYAFLYGKEGIELVKKISEFKVKSEHFNMAILMNQALEKIGLVEKQKIAEIDVSDETKVLFDKLGIDKVSTILSFDIEKYIENAAILIERPDELQRLKERNKNWGMIDFNRPIESIGLSVRSTHCLQRAGIYTLKQLVNRQYDDMLRVPNLGRKNLDAIVGCLHSMGLDFGMRVGD